MRELKSVGESRRNEDAWTRVMTVVDGEVVCGEMLVERRVTVRLESPVRETMTIESVVPDGEISEFTRYAEELLRVHYKRREQRRMAFIRKNIDTMRDKILPLWFEREAVSALYYAEIEDVHKSLRRKLRNGDKTQREYNELYNGVKMDSRAEYHRDLRWYDNELNRELMALRVEDGFHIDIFDAREIFGQSVWEDCLQVRHLTGDARQTIIMQIARGFRCFNRLYNIEPKSFNVDDILANYDTISVIGFGDIVLAAALRKGDDVVAVMARDNVQGRLALQHLVGDELLARLLPKRLYNAVTRKEQNPIAEVRFSRPRRYFRCVQ